nr:MAG TPA: hypothetical protein [Bacteriophage sp.]
MVIKSCEIFPTIAMYANTAVSTSVTSALTLKRFPSRFLICSISIFLLVIFVLCEYSLKCQQRQLSAEERPGKGQHVRQVARPVQHRAQRLEHYCPDQHARQNADAVDHDGLCHLPLAPAALVSEHHFSPSRTSAYAMRPPTIAVSAVLSTVSHAFPGLSRKACTELSSRSKRVLSCLSCSAITITEDDNSCSTLLSFSRSSILRLFPSLSFSTRVMRCSMLISSIPYLLLFLVRELCPDRRLCHRNERTELLRPRCLPLCRVRKIQLVRRVHRERLPVILHTRPRLIRLLTLFLVRQLRRLLYRLRLRHIRQPEAPRDRLLPQIVADIVLADLKPIVAVALYAPRRHADALQPVCRIAHALLCPDPHRVLICVSVYCDVQIITSFLFLCECNIVVFYAICVKAKVSV